MKYKIIKATDNDRGITKYVSTSSPSHPEFATIKHAMFWGEGCAANITSCKVQPMMEKLRTNFPYHVFEVVSAEYSPPPIAPNPEILDPGARASICVKESYVSSGRFHD